MTRRRLTPTHYAVWRAPLPSTRRARTAPRMTGERSREMVPRGQGAAGSGSLGTILSENWGSSSVNGGRGSAALKTAQSLCPTPPRPRDDYPSVSGRGRGAVSRGLIRAQSHRRTVFGDRFVELTVGPQGVPQVDVGATRSGLRRRAVRCSAIASLGRPPAIRESPRSSWARASSGRNPTAMRCMSMASAGRPLTTGDNA